MVDGGAVVKFPKNYFPFDFHCVRGWIVARKQTRFEEQNVAVSHAKWSTNCFTPHSTELKYIHNLIFISITIT